MKELAVRDLRCPTSSSRLVAAYSKALYEAHIQSTIYSISFLPCQKKKKNEIECFYFYVKMEIEVGRIQGAYPVKETVFVLDFKPNRKPSSPGMLGGSDLSHLLT